MGRASMWKIIKKNIFHIFDILKAICFSEKNTRSIVI